jgi:hypothetical protein
MTAMIRMTPEVDDRGVPADVVVAGVITARTPGVEVGVGRGVKVVRKEEGTMMRRRKVPRSRKCSFRFYGSSGGMQR